MYTRSCSCNWQRIHSTGLTLFEGTTFGASLHYIQLLPFFFSYFLSLAIFNKNMYRSLLRVSTPAAARAVTTTSTCVRSGFLTSTSSSLSRAHYESSLQTQLRSLHGGAPLAATPVCRFDLRKHEMEKRKKRDMEKAGIDPNDDDDGPWIAPEEQQRLDEEEEQRRAELEEARKAFLQKRAEEDAEKRQKFKEFRAKQIAMSRTRKMETAEKKEEARQHRDEQHQRVVGDDGAAATGGSAEEAAEGEAAAEKLNEAAAGGNPMVAPK